MIQTLATGAEPYKYGKAPVAVQSACALSHQLCERGQYDSALAAANRAIVAGLEYVEGFEAAANVYLQNGDAPRALKALNWAVSHFPTASITLGMLGYLLGENGQLREAIRLLELSLRYDPMNSDTLRNLGWYYCELGKENVGEALLLRAKTLGGGRNMDLVLTDLAYVAIKKGEKTRAWQYYDEARATPAANAAVLDQLRLDLVQAFKML